MSTKEYYQKNKEKVNSWRKTYEPIWSKTPRGLFSAQKRQAKQRKIDWFLTFEEWWNLWRNSGKWDLRGIGYGKYCMSRFKDTGPYSIDNIEIKSSVDNSREGTFLMQQRKKIDPNVARYKDL